MFYIYECKLTVSATCASRSRNYYFTLDVRICLTLSILINNSGETNCSFQKDQPGLDYILDRMEPCKDFNRNSRKCYKVLEYSAPDSTFSIL